MLTPSICFGPFQVEEVYSLVHQTMTQTHVKDYVPFSWATMVHVKAEHFKALSHYYAAVALCDCPRECPGSAPGVVLGGGGLRFRLHH